MEASHEALDAPPSWITGLASMASVGEPRGRAAAPGPESRLATAQCDPLRADRALSPASGAGLARAGHAGGAPSARLGPGVSVALAAAPQTDCGPAGR